jgi:putative PIG3 family NAD(P)H quinone oxidoreductase
VYPDPVKAVVFDRYGDEDVLRVDEVPTPELGAGELRIAVRTAGVNRADLLQRRGLYPPPAGASTILGLECAGTVTEVGEQVDGFTVGDRVMALLAGGGYAEQVVVDARCAMMVPSELDDASAGGLPEAFLTAFFNLCLLGSLGPEDWVLIHGGSGGVGTAAIQLSDSLGATALATAGSDERCQRCRDLGARDAFNYRSEDFVERTRDTTDGRGVDVVLDCIGAAYLERNLSLLAPGGRLVVIGLMGGAKADLDLARLLRQRLTVVGSTLRSRSPHDKGRIIEQFSSRFGIAVHRGALAPVIDRVLPLASTAEAHRLLETGQIFGKIVLAIDCGSPGKTGKTLE